MELQKTLQKTLKKYEDEVDHLKKELSLAQDPVQISHLSDLLAITIPMISYTKDQIKQVEIWEAEDQIRENKFGSVGAFIEYLKLECRLT